MQYIIDNIDPLYNIFDRNIVAEADGLGWSPLYLAATNNLDNYDTDFLELLIRKYPPALIGESEIDIPGFPTGISGGTPAAKARSQVKMDEDDPDDTGERPVVDLLEAATAA